MIFYGIHVYFVTDIESTATRVLRKAFLQKPTQDQIKETVDEWIIAVAEACDNHRSLYKVKTILNIQVIDFFVEVEQWQ